MAGLTRKKPAPWTIEKIKAGLIVNRLEKHIFAPRFVQLPCDDPDAPPVTIENPDLMTQSQVTAALGLLKKVHPDLASQKVEMTEPVRVLVEYVNDTAAK